MLPTSVGALLADRSLWIDRDARLPALTEADRVAAEQALAVYAQAPRGSSPERISTLVGSAAIGYPAQKVSDKEADARLKLYQEQLADIDSDVLAAAFSAVIKVSRFFPTIAEIREQVAKLPAPPRVVFAWRLRQLLRAQPEPEPMDLATPDQLASIKVGAEGMPYVAPAPTSRPTLQTYLEHGLTEEDAHAMLAEHDRILARQRPSSRTSAHEKAIFRDKAA